MRLRVLLPVVALVAVAAIPFASALKQGSWTRGPDALMKRTDGSAAKVARSIYYVGGFVEGGGNTAAVERYEIDRKRWSRVRPMPAALDHATAVGHRGFLYVLGGYRRNAGAQAIVRTLYRYDPRRNHWSSLPPAPTARAALAVGAIGGRLYAAGGVSERGAVSTLEIYDIPKRRWSTGPPFAVPREHLGGATLGGSFYAVGGRNASGNLKIVERYTPGRGWKRVADLAKARGGNAATAWVARKRVITAGGEEDGGTIEQVEEFDGKRWHPLPEMATPRHGLGVVFDERGKRLFTVEGGPEPGLAFSNRLEILRRD